MIPERSKDVTTLVGIMKAGKK